MCKMTSTRMSESVHIDAYVYVRIHISHTRATVHVQTPQQALQVLHRHAPQPQTLNLTAAPETEQRHIRIGCQAKGADSARPAPQRMGHIRVLGFGVLERLTTPNLFKPTDTTT